MRLEGRVRKPPLELDGQRVIPRLVDRVVDIDGAELVGEHEMGVQQRWPFMVRGRDGFWHMPKDRPSIPQMWSVRARKAG